MSWYYYIPLWTVLVALIGWLLPHLDKKVTRYKALFEKADLPAPLSIKCLNGKRCNLYCVRYDDSRKLKQPYQRSKERMAVAVLKDSRKLDGFAVVFDTDKGLYEVCAELHFADTSLSPGKDPEGNECTVLNIKWRTITAPVKLRVRNGFITYNNHIMEYLDGLNYYDMKAGDSVNIAYTCNINDDAGVAS